MARAVTARAGNRSQRPRSPSGQWGSPVAGAAVRGFRADSGELVGVLKGGLSSRAAPTKSDDFGWLGWGCWEMGQGSGASDCSEGSV